MIQQALVFLLGFLAALFIALLGAPALWRRAATVTRRRIEASIPLSREELFAEADRVRAESAMQIRKLEIELKAAREAAARHRVEASRNANEFRALRDTATRLETADSEHTTEVESLRAQLKARDAEVEKLSAELTTACNEIERKLAELERIERHQEETAFDISKSQIELAARETRIDQMAGELQSLRQRLDAALAENRKLAAELSARKAGPESRGGRLVESESRLTRLATALAEAEDKLGRREKELARLRHNGGQAYVERLESEKAAQDDRLRRLTAENRRMRGAAATGSGAGDDRDALRAQISALAAEVVHLTERLEGPDSPIRDIIRPSRGTDNPPSIADRVRALRQEPAKS